MNPRPLTYEKMQVLLEKNILMYNSSVGYILGFE